MRKRKGWRQYYRVWLQAEGRDSDDREYAGECLTCTEPARLAGKAGRWIFHAAGSRAEAWALCGAHESETHSITATVRGEWGDGRPPMHMDDDAEYYGEG